VAKRVAVLGGGVAGLSVAHELLKWNDAHPGLEPYEISVFENRGCEAPDLGGKCRSWRMPQDPASAPPSSAAPPSGAAPPPGPSPLTGEHGFRLFPGFYKNVVETMSEIEAADSTPQQRRTVVDHLTPLETAEFFARRLDTEPGFAVSARAQRWANGLRLVAPFAAGVWLLGGPVVISWFGWPGWSYAIWFAVMFVWKTLRWSVEAAAVGPTAEMPIPLRKDGSGKERSWFPKLVGKLPLFRWWWIGIAVLVVWWGPPWPVWVEMVLVAVLWTGYNLFFAQCWLWMSLRGAIPHDVKPRGFESIAMFAWVIQLVGSCTDRFYRQWDRRTWWEYVAAYKQSPQYQLTLATGLTRSFVATKADRMSARTGGAILAQLIYDLNPYFPRTHPPDRVLDGPTSEVWIGPWVSQLVKAGVHMNCYEQHSATSPRTDCVTLPGTNHEFRNVLVQRLLLNRDGTRIDGFAADVEERNDPTSGSRGSDGTEGPKAAEPHETMQNVADFAPRGEFDHYVLAVPGPAAQQILGNSPDVLRQDRSVVAGRPTDPMSGKHAIPYLDGIFELEFSWMTGIVFHLDRELPGLPRGHTLYLDSTWALTAIDERRVWSAGAGVPGTGTILSVVVSDWFHPSDQGIPAVFSSTDHVAEEVWRQLGEHLGTLRGLPMPDRHEVIFDQAIIDPDPKEVEQKVVHYLQDGTDASAALAVENLPLTNSEKLLINTAGSWGDRPCARTSFPNLFVAADYVRTQVDFASMESANEAARWAVRALVASDHPDPPNHPEQSVVPPVPRGLEDPKHIRGLLNVFRWVDKGLYWLGWPTPGGIVAAPFAFLSTLENRYRNTLDHRFRPKGLPRRND
jgi:uncharacterized protein with NAD-binding domain and iron-sulfur cluster